MPDIRKTLNFDEAEIKFTGDGTQGVFEGYASVFSHQDLDGDIILPGAFKHVLDKQKQKVAMFYNHRVWELPVGKWEYMEEDQKGLRVRGQLTPGHSAAQDLKAAMKHGTVDGLSIGFGCLRNDFERTPSGRIFKNISLLREISICTFPANDQAQVSSLKSIDGLLTIRDIEDWLRESAGLSKSEAVGFISRFKSAIRSESDDTQQSLVASIVNQINAFNLKG
ncbi:HK97 family phage prohead protease [Proteus sp. DFP240708]|uniref:HK97 family phage prohead protease n=1 Tax=Proteus penneri TaxID=102862 RepID=A0ABS0VZX1_9GAMM|nr:MULTISPECIES: HK97 family phage prohead protease [Proteus]AGS60719.1 head maturation protease [Proteus mirabilis BB2000]MBG3019382.1 HK97 family phage prohead protease [Proteus mirabilis]MBI6340223.1 HK97 family phage prohead protease [Proteus sp. PR00224]MBI6416401.1 HK97 family phage prohead protease [Proteus mirabilis]MBI6473156.1 HK97 family phage prohead protease [Proteus mirabilis]